MLYVGIDVAKNKHDVTALNVRGKLFLNHSLLSGGTPMLYVGIDVAKNKHDVTALNVRGKLFLNHSLFQIIKLVLNS
ncbi:degenerate transposase [Streptococcus pneumoniae]|nr:degenerate transposase [Streptococcus pneumoniae]